MISPFANREALTTPSLVAFLLILPKRRYPTVLIVLILDADFYTHGYAESSQRPLGTPTQQGNTPTNSDTRAILTTPRQPMRSTHL
jgi:hypothetical protein